MSESVELIIAGGGLAGSEAAWQASLRGIKVLLYEMRPKKFTPAHKSHYLGELVCSNSLGAERRENAAGILKEELTLLDSLIMKAALDNRLPAGGALAVDREGFAAQITAALEKQPGITVLREELCEIAPDTPTIIATGPLTSEALAAALASLTGEEHLYFYDAISPVLAADSIDFSVAFKASRYDKGGADYINCPLGEKEYISFWKELTGALRHRGEEFEKKRFFEGCMPVEELARRGEKTLLFGPMKPVGLRDPRTGTRPHAVLQLRQENRAATMYNMVGFQTSLKRGEQKRIFRMVPGLEGAEFLRYGSMHRNTFINAPQVLNRRLQHKERGNIFFAGQLTGVEGYMESTASGLLAGIFAAEVLKGRDPQPPPATTAGGALLNYLSSAEAKYFQPMNINLGLFPPLPEKVRDKKLRARAICQRAINDLTKWKEGLDG